MLSDKSKTLIILYAIVPQIGTLIALLTGSLVYWYGGFPMPWRIPYYLYLGRPCPCPPGPSFYDLSWREIDYWPGLVYDLLFYTAIGYGLLLAYVVYDQQRQRPALSV